MIEEAAFVSLSWCQHQSFMMTMVLVLLMMITKMAMMTMIIKAAMMTKMLILMARRADKFALVATLATWQSPD